MDKKIEKLKIKIYKAEKLGKRKKLAKLNKKFRKLLYAEEIYMDKAVKSKYDISHAKKYRRLRIVSKVLPILGVSAYLYFAVYSKLIINEPEIKPIILNFTYGMFDVGVVLAAIILLLIPLYYSGKLFFRYLKSSKINNDIAENLGSINFKYDPNVRLFWTGLFGAWIFPFIYLINKFGYKLYETINIFIDKINVYLDLQSDTVSEVFKEFVTEFSTDFISMFEKGILIMFIAYISWFVMDMTVVRLHEHKKRKHFRLKAELDDHIKEHQLEDIAEENNEEA